MTSAPAKRLRESPLRELLVLRRDLGGVLFVRPAEPKVALGVSPRSSTLTR